MSGQSSHMMRTTRRGRPFLKDTGDLYSTLILSLPLENRRHFFKSYPNAFTTDEAAANLASLKFSQSSRAADPKDPTRIITTTTTTTFSMSREMAKGICQHFMDARLIENASDISSRTFKDRGVYISTSKGLHVLERFMTKNGISSESVVKCFQKQPVCMKLLHLERRSADDDIIITRSVIEVLFRRMLGREPHVSTLSDEDLDAMKASRWFAKTATTPDVKEDEFDQADGMIIRKNMLNPNEKRAYDEYTFKAFHAVDWIMEYTSCVCVEEAAEVGAQMVRYGFMALAQDKSKIKEGNFIAHAKGGGAGGAQQAQLNDGEFRAADRAIYKITKEGFILLKWDVPGLVTRASAAASKANLLADSASTVSKSTPSRSSHSTDDVHSVTGTPVAQIRGGGTKEHLRAEFADSPHGQQAAADKDHSSHTAKLKQILDEPALRSLFREFLRANYCEENLSFWLDVQDFKKKFATTSSVANPDANKNRVGHAAMEKHQQELISMGFVIYNTYLAPASPAELNIDHNLRAELITHMNQINADKEAGVKGSVEPGVGNTLHASQLQILIRLYERIQAYIYRLMATDSVPKFCKTERYLQLMKSMFDYNEKYLDYDATDQKLVVQDEDDSPSRAYLTISQAANEKFAAKIQAEDEEMKKMSRGYRG